MAGLTSLLYTARDALSAQSYGLTVTGQNIANVATPGYTRRVAILETNAIVGESTGGVKADELRRITDQFTEDRLLDSNGLSSAAEHHDWHLGAIEVLFNDLGGTGLSQSLDNLFNSFGILAANPNDTTSRATVLARAETFANDVNRIADALAQKQSELVIEAQDRVDQVNQKTSEIARINRQIDMARHLGQDAADLEDRRRQVLLELSELVDVHTFYDSSGGLVVQGAGTTLVEGNVARSLGIELNTDGTMRLNAVHESGQATEVTRYLTGGKLSAIFETRDTDIFEIFEKLDTFVFDTATAINAQHAAGVGLDGVGGRALFSLTATSDGAARALQVSSDILGQPDRLAAASDALSLPGGSDNAVALAQLAQQYVAGGGTQTPSEAYAEVVGDVAQRRSNALRMAETREAIREQVSAMREAMSGVSLDEEMVALTKFQRAYEAATKVLNVADELLEELMMKVG